MAAADLGRSGSRSHSLRGSARAWLITYVAIWALTLGCAAIVALIGAPVSVPVHHLLELRLSSSTNPRADLDRVLGLAAHNILIVSWPLLLGALGVHRSRRARCVADCLVLACIVINVAPVGAALGAYGLALVPYVPQLPLEWGALCAGADAWLQHRESPIGRAEALRRLAMIASLLCVAALLETLATPRR
jgi:hypothetical protein